MPAETQIPAATLRAINCLPRWWPGPHPDGVTRDAYKGWDRDVFHESICLADDDTRAEVLRRMAAVHFEHASGQAYFLHPVDAGVWILYAVISDFGVGCDLVKTFRDLQSSATRATAAVAILGSLATKGGE